MDKKVQNKADMSQIILVEFTLGESELIQRHFTTIQICTFPTEAEMLKVYALGLKFSDAIKTTVVGSCVTVRLCRGDVVTLINYFKSIRFRDVASRDELIGLYHAGISLMREANQHGFQSSLKK